MRARLLLSAALLAALACDRSAPAPPAPEPRAPAARPAAKPAAVPWAWRPFGNLVVLEGEIPEGADLVLSGPRIYETRRAPAGPLRWEIVRPPEGERAELRTAAGKVLARFRFEQPTAPPAGAPAAPGAGTPALDPPGPEAALPGPPPPPAVPALPAPPPPAAPPPRPEPPPTVRVDPQLQAKLDLPSARRGPAPVLPVPGHATAPARVAPAPSLPAPSLPLTKGEPWPGAGEGLHLARGPRGGKRLVLTFDGGSTAEVADEILDALKARGVRTTLFLTGAFIQKHPALVRRMAQEGHELGNHTMNHPHLAPAGRRDARWTKERVQRELLDADQALCALLGRPMDPYWRAPYGEQTAEIRKWAEEIGYRHIGWSEGADTLDWATAADRRLYRSGTAILDRLYLRLGRDGDGMIVLMHLGSARPEEDRPSHSLGAFMDRAARDGWRFVTVGACLSGLGKPAWDPAARLAWLGGPGGRSGGSRR